jgi:chemotaxis protein MotA
MFNSSTLGIVLGIGVFLSALLLGQVPIELLIKPESLVLVFGGTLSALLVTYPPRLFWKTLRGLGADRSWLNIPESEFIQYVRDVAQFIRTEGALSLQSHLQNIQHPLLHKGLLMVVDNAPASEIRHQLEVECDLICQEMVDAAQILESAGGVAPTMGIIGTIIGLIHVVQSFHDPVELGHGVAGAFSATLYGISFANLLLLPLAEKIRNSSKSRYFQLQLMIEGIEGISQREHPRLLEERLSIFLRDTQHIDIHHDEGENLYPTDRVDSSHDESAERVVNYP